MLNALTLLNVLPTYKYFVLEILKKKSIKIKYIFRIITHSFYNDTRVFFTPLNVKNILSQEK